MIHCTQVSWHSMCAIQFYIYQRVTTIKATETTTERINVVVFASESTSFVVGACVGDVAVGATGGTAIGTTGGVTVGEVGGSTIGGVLVEFGALVAFGALPLDGAGVTATDDGAIGETGAPVAFGEIGATTGGEVGRGTEVGSDNSSTPQESRVPSLALTRKTRPWTCLAPVLTHEVYDAAP